ncbi:hypothetical protein AGOR_G00124770 [Albula goreensis]|uniref:Uncharacterized protein n=1 Tax=Albula goreensis TaxID=1534307 RepID=A0A8T3D7K8_9TELE|nr:hypothetical protein AGOR_G00124770 [Albula goreensis]
MDVTFATPHWLTKAREEIETSKDWKCFTTELSEIMQQQLAENFTGMLSDLSETEKALLVERAAKAVHARGSGTDTIAHISSILEDVLSCLVAVEMSERHVVSQKTDLIQSHVRNGMVSLLNKWPDMKSKLSILFNHPLPKEIREVAWKLYLSNSKARMDYLMAVSVNNAKSRRDLDVCLQCDSLLAKGFVFHTLSNNGLAVSVLKRVLSYYHSIQHHNGSLPESDCLLLVPLLEVALSRSTSSASLDSLATQLVEQYLSFMDSWPAVVKSRKPGAHTRTESGDIYQEVASKLDQKDKELSRLIWRLHPLQDAQIKESLLTGVKDILQPVIEVFFVGYLAMPSLLYVWDQYIIGLDSPSYDCLPAFCFAFLLLLKDHLQHCGTSSEMAEVARSQGPTLSVPQLQSVISMYFYEELFKKLNQDKIQGFPVVDPTQIFFPPWTHLSTSKLPVRTKPRDRRQAREIREAKRISETERKIQEAQAQKLKKEDEIRREEVRLQKELEEARQVGREQRIFLEEQLAQERQHHYEIQKVAEEQINQLKVEVRKIREYKLLINDTEGSFGTPPPSAESQTDLPESFPPAPSCHKTLSPARDPRQVDPRATYRTVKDVAVDLLQRMSKTVGIIHGKDM